MAAETIPLSWLECLLLKWPFMLVVVKWAWDLKRECGSQAKSLWTCWKFKGIKCPVFINQVICNDITWLVKLKNKLLFYSNLSWPAKYFNTCIFALSLIFDCCKQTRDSFWFLPLPHWSFPALQNFPRLKTCLFNNF